MEQESRHIIDVIMEHLSEMRLVAEGAVALFDKNQGHYDPQIIDLIGEALYLLRNHLQDIQSKIADDSQILGK